MSLILTQSDSTPGSNPASYVNRFKNTFQIKANAEIAVQEVVLNRMGRFVVHQGARVFIRHGADDFHTPLRVSLAAGTYTPDELATHMEAQLNAYDSHPQFQGGWKCNSVYNGVVFQRFNIHVEQKVKVAASGPPTSTERCLHEKIGVQGLAGLCAAKAGRTYLLFCHFSLPSPRH